MSIPLRIHGPAIVTLNGVSWYFKNGLKVAAKTSTGTITVDAFGEIATYLKDRMIEVTGTPVGCIRTGDIGATLPFGPSNVGFSIFGASDVPLVVQTINDGQTITWERGAVSKYPAMLLSATGGTIYSGDMTFTCIMASSFTPTGAAAWKAITTAAFADTTFDPSKVRMGQYVASWGNSSPFSSMIAQEGFKFTPQIATENISVDNFGVIDMVVKSVSAAVTFKPANLTEANLDTLIAIQNTGAAVPGTVFGDSGNDLVITGPHLAVTLKQCGASNYDLFYGTGKLRAGEVQFLPSMTFTTGAQNALWTLAVS